MGKQSINNHALKMQVLEYSTIEYDFLKLMKFDILKAPWIISH